MATTGPKRSLESRVASGASVAVTVLLGVVGLVPFVWAMYRALLEGKLPGAVEGAIAAGDEPSRQGFVLAISIVTAGLLLCAIIALRRFRTPNDREPYNPPSFSTGVAIILIGAALAAIAVSQ